MRDNLALMEAKALLLGKHHPSWRIPHSVTLYNAKLFYFASQPLLFKQSLGVVVGWEQTLKLS